MIKWSKVFRAILGIVVVGALVWVVNNWWGQYKNAAVSATSSAVATPTVDPGSPKITTGTAGVTYAVIKSDGVNFRVKPASSAKLIRGMNKGEKIVVLAKEGQWYEVKDGKGKLGWVTADSDYVALQ